jgi:phosphoglycolate phosphatase-like HAD superfamily hydrolase
VSSSLVRTPVFDLDGTLVDSDAALVAPFLALGVPEDDITFGHVLADECDRLGLSVEDYVRHYDIESVQPFAGVDEMLAELGRWAVCSNKLAQAGHQELDRLGWKPEVALFADAFEGPKQLVPVLSAMGLEPTDVVFVGDTAHDRALARSLHVTFALAGWNPRAQAEPDDVVLARPLDVLDLLAG